MCEASFVPLEPVHLASIERQPSQRVLMGVDAQVTEGEARVLCSMPEAWAMIAGGRVLACFGISELFVGRHGVAWSVLAVGLGQHHLALTRFLRARLARCRHRRIETFAICADVEGVVGRNAEADTGHLVALAMLRPTPEIRWAVLLGFKPAHVLRRYGGADESYMLMERITPRAARAGGRD